MTIYGELYEEAMELTGYPNAMSKVADLAMGDMLRGESRYDARAGTRPLNEDEVKRLIGEVKNRVLRDVLEVSRDLPKVIRNQRVNDLRKNGYLKTSEQLYQQAVERLK